MDSKDSVSGSTRRKSRKLRPWRVASDSGPYESRLRGGGSSAGVTMLRLLVVAAWALLAGAPALANIALTGPYVVDFETFSPCDEIGSLQIVFDVLLVNKDDGTVYEGNVTFPFDMDDEKLLSHFKAYRWGSTGGWSSFYNLTQYDILSYAMQNFPNVFGAFYGAMGIKGKPAPAGTYHMENFKPMGLKLKNLSSLPYGRYLIHLLHSKDDVDVGCFQFTVEVKEEPSAAPAGKKFG